MTTDFVLQASTDQSELSNVRNVTQAVNLTCPIYDGCNVIGTGTLAQAQASVGDGGTPLDGSVTGPGGPEGSSSGGSGRPPRLTRRADERRKQRRLRRCTARARRPGVGWSPSRACSASSSAARFGRDAAVLAVEGLIRSFAWDPHRS